ncbi:MAG: hypothetical protein U0L47_03360 [Paludibacteraceae bacterium]|nr:hypothetical protein [Paludibacteraceae bacterium]
MKRFVTFFGMALCMLMGFFATVQASTITTIGPVDNYGFLTGPDGSTWTYTAAYTTQDGEVTAAEISIYDNYHKLVGTLNETFQLAETDRYVRDVEINSLVTRKFFNSDNNIEIMLFISVATKDYTGRFYNSVFSLSEGGSTHVCNVDGNQVLAKNISTNNNDNYTMVFFRQYYDENNTLYYNYDVYGKAEYGTSQPVLKHTFEIPYQNIAALNDPMPIYMIQSGKYTIDYIVAQYEKPFFDPSIPVYEEPIVNPDNHLVITRYDNKFKQLSEVKIPMLQDEDPAFLYTFYYLGGLGGQNDVILDYNGTGDMAFVVTVDNYETASDGSVYSYYLYDANGNKINTIAEKGLGTIYMSNLPGHSTQYGFLKNENDVEFIQMVDVPSCKTVARIPLYNGGALLSGNWDRVAQGESYQYVVSLLQGDNAADGTIHQRIAWFTNKGKLDHYDDLNLGKRVETAQVNIQAAILNPRLFNADNAREYMVLLKRTKAGSSDKEEVLLICNNEGETLLELGSDAAKGGALSMINVLNETTNPMLLCAYNNDSQFTLNFHALPLSKNTLQGDGTAANPYQITCATDFIQIDDKPMAYYQIMNDIDFGGAAFTGLKKAFGGKLDGGNMQLTNLYLNGSGLFREVVDTAVIKNIRLIDPIMALNSNGLYAGLVANTMRGGFADGVADEGGTLHGLSAILHDVHVVAPTIVGTNFAGVCGGLIGEASLFVQMSECSVQDAVIELPNAEAVGGLVGHMMTSSSMNVAAFSGRLQGGATVGGIAASVDGDCPVHNAHVDADIAGATIVGGIAGNSDRATITNCYVEGNLTLAMATDKGGVGGIVGALATDIMGQATDAIVHDNIVALQSINAPTEAKAHRIIGFSSCNDYEYDWNNVDYSKPQAEWPRIYFNTEKGLKDNYVISDLALIDATIAASDTTTEGADMAASELTAEWLNAHGFVLGNSIDAPWVLNKAALYLWFEEGRTGTGVEDIWTDNTTSTARKLLINGQVVIVRDGQMYSVLGVRL